MKSLCQAGTPGVLADRRKPDAGDALGCDCGGRGTAGVAGVSGDAQGPSQAEGAGAWGEGSPPCQEEFPAGGGGDKATPDGKEGPGVVAGLPRGAGSNGTATGVGVATRGARSSWIDRGRIWSLRTGRNRRRNLRLRRETLPDPSVLTTY